MSTLRILTEDYYVYGIKCNDDNLKPAKFEEKSLGEERKKYPKSKEIHLTRILSERIIEIWLKEFFHKISR